MVFRRKIDCGIRREVEEKTWDFCLYSEDLGQWEATKNPQPTDYQLRILAFP